MATNVETIHAKLPGDKPGKRTGPAEYYSVRVPNPRTGGVLYKRFKLGKKKEAEAYAAEQNRLRNAGIVPAPKMTVAELIGKYQVVHANRVRGSTVDASKSSLQWIQEHLGTRLVSTIQPEDFDRVRDAKIAAVRAAALKNFEKRLARNPDLLAGADKARAEIARCGTRAGEKVIVEARRLWKHAVKHGLTERNVAQFADKPRRERDPDADYVEANILTPAEIQRFIAHVDPEHQTCVAFLFMTGLRFGELVGLQWTDVDWASGRVFIRRQWSRFEGAVAPLKTAAARRSIGLAPSMITKLKTLKLRSRGEFVFGTSGGTTLDPAAFRDRVWHPALRRAGLRSIRPHDARHTFASMLIAAGVNVVVVARRLGHSSAVTTLKTYSHAFDLVGDVAEAEVLERFMASQTERCETVVSGNPPAAVAAVST
jgi:integrase